MITTGEKSIANEMVGTSEAEKDQNPNDIKTECYLCYLFAFIDYYNDAIVSMRLQGGIFSISPASSQ